MALLQTRLHSGTTSHAFAQRIVCHLEAAINRVAKRVHVNAPSAPLPTIADSVCALIEADSALLAEFCSPNTNQTFIDEVAAVVSSTFTRYRADFEPDERDVAKALADRKLAHAAFPLLSLSERLAIVRSLSRADAVGMCQRKVEAKRAILRESLANVEIPISVTSNAERAAAKNAGHQNWTEQARTQKRREVHAS